MPGRAAGRFTPGIGVARTGPDNPKEVFRHGNTRIPAIAFLAAAEGTEQVKLIEPWQAVLAMGWQPLLVSPAPDKIQMFNHLDRGDTKDVDLPVGDAAESGFAGLVQPIRRFQSGVVNDYVTWIVIGVACVGGTLAFSIR